MTKIRRFTAVEGISWPTGMNVTTPTRLQPSRTVTEADEQVRGSDAGINAHVTRTTSEETGVTELTDAAMVDVATTAPATSDSPTLVESVTPIETAEVTHGALDDTQGLDSLNGEETPNEHWTVPEINAFADANGIEIDYAARKGEKLAVIQEALEARTTDAEVTVGGAE